MSTTSPRRIAGLDGLRAVAVLLVFLFHERLLLPFGWVGVQLFFVLSGFLITGILDAGRDRPAMARIWRFYGRRTLRIFPLYYAYLLGVVGLAGASALAVGRVPHEAERALTQLPWALGYGYNLLHASVAFEHSRVLTHFWSLAVEEQFYLLWPAMIWLTPRNRLPWLLWAVVLTGPWLRLATWLLAPSLGGDPALSAYVLPWCQLDAFAWGALAAHLPVRRPALGALGGLILLVGTAMATAPEAIGALGLPCPIDGGLRAAFLYAGIDAVAAMLLLAVVRDGLGVRWLEHPVLVWIGTRSYGLYVLHFPLQGVTAVAFPQMTLGAKIALDLGLSFLACELAYRVVELPFLRLKDRWFGARSESRAVRAS
jgi:peptidoglycan/LPS O-acetylase OafA/YrhL